MKYSFMIDSITQLHKLTHTVQMYGVHNYMFVINSVKAENIDVFLLHPIYPSFFQCAFQKLALEP